jgi:hypothetical protein
MPVATTGNSSSNTRAGYRWRDAVIPILLVDKIDALAHSRAQVKYECQLPPEYGEVQSGVHHPAISALRDEAWVAASDSYS